MRERSKRGERFREWEGERYKKRKRSILKNTDFTIITSNCVGTIIYYDLNLPFLSPTINLTIGIRDFIKLAGNLKGYMEKEMVEIEGESGYPTGLLGDIKINFIHYKSFQEGFLKWEERKKRINWDNLFFIGTERWDCNYEVLQRFDELPCKNKVFFTHLEYPEISSSYYIKGFENQRNLGEILSFKDQFLKRRYLDEFDYVSFFNSSEYR